MKIHRPYWHEAVMIILAVAIILMILYGCGPSVAAGLRCLPKPAARVSAGPAGVLSSLSLWATWAAGVGLLLCGIAAVFLPNKLQIARIALGCFAALLIAGLLSYVALYWKTLMVLIAVVLGLSALGYGYLHRKEIEKYTGVDIDQDGKLGE